MPGLTPRVWAAHSTTPTSCLQLCTYLTIPKQKMQWLLAYIYVCWYVCHIYQPPHSNKPLGDYELFKATPKSSNFTPSVLIVHQTRGHLGHTPTACRQFKCREKRKKNPRKKTFLLWTPFPSIWGLLPHILGTSNSLVLPWGFWHKKCFFIFFLCKHRRSLPMSVV